jgi:septal ring factor EnvC (AmiA/AmiB activator)
LCLFSLAGQAQSRQELEAQRKRLAQDISRNNTLLKKTKHAKEKTMALVQTLSNQIRNREQLLDNLNSEIAIIESSITRSQEVIEALDGDMQRLQLEYARNLRRTWRMRQSQPLMLFVLSGEGLARAFKRWQYIRQYDRYRKRQASLIQITIQDLRYKKEAVALRLEEKTRILNQVDAQKVQLDSERKLKNKHLINLKSNEKDLLANIDKQSKARRKLDDNIEALVIAEMRAKRERARLEAEAAAKKKTLLPLPAKKETATAPSYTQSAADVSTNQAFVATKKKLPWPVAGTIYQGYGNQKHPLNPHVTIYNRGIDIKATSGDEVHSVFAGEVTAIQFEQGSGYTILVSHGEYFTIYAWVHQPTVRAGQKIKARQTLGRVSDDNLYQVPLIHFEIWKGKSDVNPTQWLQ